jgi:hypothetical protein
MTRIRRKIGLYYGFFTVIGCTVHILGSMLHNKEWLYFVPIAAGMAWVWALVQTCTKRMSVAASFYYWGPRPFRCEDGERSHVAYRDAKRVLSRTSDWLAIPLCFVLYGRTALARSAVRAPQPLDHLR